MRDARRYGAALAAMLLAGLLAGAASAQDPSLGYAPTARIDLPALDAAGPRQVGTTVTFHVDGQDPDGPTGLPVAWRALFAPAELPDGTPVTNRPDFEAHLDELVDWGDADWSAWRPWSADPDAQRLTYGGLPLGHYLFAVQVIDTTGVVSLEREYQQQVAHIQVVEGLVPRVLVCETYLGCLDASAAGFEIASGQPLNFSWTADASEYGGTIVSYRHGWDLLDPEDPQDPGWAVPAGLGPQNLADTERSFADGLHMLTLRVEDDAGTAVLVTRQVSVVPWVPRDAQMELLVVDQVHDDNVNDWPDADGNPRNHESYRNAWWQFLADGPGGVMGLDWSRDRFDHTETPRLSDVVPYKAVLCYARRAETQTLFGQLRPHDGIDGDGDPVSVLSFDWLDAYQRMAGNLLLVGERSQYSFLQSRADYMTPLLFTAVQDTTEFAGFPFVTGFGDAELPEGTVRVGPRLHPYATSGIALLDWTSSAISYVYARPQTTARMQRRVDCVGLKGLVLDPDFKARHGVGASDFPDTILTDGVIDWQDQARWDGGVLGIVTDAFPWRDDEFVDADISPGRPEAWSPQACDDPAAPGGLCVEPMFRGLARFDWLREFMRSHGDPDWPPYNEMVLADSCGTLALTDYDPGGGEVEPSMSARTEGQVFGYLSHRYTSEKVSNAPDAYWGFDPYRFDSEAARDAVRWTLRMFGVNVRD